METTYLIMVNGDRNNNKFYNLIPNGNGTWTAEYGRVGKTTQRRTYSDYEWDKKYWEKINKGYTDVTHLQTTEEVAVKSDIADPEVADLISKLTAYSSDFIKRNYTVATGQVTTAMVNRVQDLIAMMKNETNVWSFNRKMEEILTTIPRQASSVRALLAETDKDFADILEREQSILNVLASKVKSNEVMVGGKDMLEAHGLTIKPVSDGEKKAILDHLDNSTRSRFVRAFRVENKITEDRFNKFCADNGYGEGDIHFNYHGSRNRNWLGILQQGLQLNPKAPTTGHMFSAPGCGIYTATSSAKSANYASLRSCYWNSESADRGYLAVFKVAMKNPYHIYKHETKHSSLKQSDMDRMGCDGTFAHKGVSLKADEIITYNPAQVTIRYLIEIA